MISLIHWSEDEALHGLGEPLVVVGVRNGAGLSLDLVGCIAHRDAEAGALEHQDVVWLVADGRDLLGWYFEPVGQVLQYRTLVCILVGDVQVVGLRPVGARSRAERRLGIGLATPDAIE